MNDPAVCCFNCPVKNQVDYDLTRVRMIPQQTQPQLLWVIMQQADVLTKEEADLQVGG